MMALRIAGIESNSGPHLDESSNSISATQPLKDHLLEANFLLFIIPFKA